MKLVNIFMVIACLVLTAPDCIGQAVGRRISETTLGIFNNSDKDLNFELGTTKEELKNYSIASRENWISPIFPAKAKPLLRIKTGSLAAQYTLRLNSKYMIFWNSRKKKWDLTKIKVVNENS